MISAALKGWVQRQVEGCLEGAPTALVCKDQDGRNRVQSSQCCLSHLSVGKLAQLMARALQASVRVLPPAGSWVPGAPEGPRGLWPQEALLPPLRPHPHHHLQALGLLERHLSRGGRHQTGGGRPPLANTQENLQGPPLTQPHSSDPENAAGHFPLFSSCPSVLFGSFYF